MRELYVYYRVPSVAAAAFEIEVRALQAELRVAIPGLDARCLRRVDDSGVRQTWMETYALEPGQGPEGVSPGLQAEIEARAARQLTRIEGARHVEVFLACAS